MKASNSSLVLGLAAMTWGVLTTGQAAGLERTGGLDHFITRSGSKLMDGDQPFRFIGAANTELQGYAQSPWYCMPPTEYELRDAFETMCQMGQQAVRTYAFAYLTDRPQFGHIGKHVIGNRKYNEEAFRSFDKMLQLAEAHGVRVIVPFVCKWAFGSNHDAFASMHGRRDFYRSAREEFKQFITDVVTRRNTFTGRLYKDEKAILAWQLGNELAPPAEWESEMAAHLKKVAPNHLVASGLRGLHRNSLRDPNIDIVDYHPYPGPPSNLNSFEHVARQGKVVIFGEFGGKGGGAAVRPFLDKFIASEIAGANWWAVISRYRWGGYGRFQPESVQGYSRLHWPYWDRYQERLHDVPEILTALQDAAFKLQGKPVPEHRVPVPKAPELLPIDDALQISWRGPTGARWYEVQHAGHPEGEWVTVGERVSDDCVPGWFGSIFAHSNAPAGKGYYRVRAANEAGLSPWSNVVELGAPHPIMTEMYLGPNLLANWSFEDGDKGWSGIDGKTAVRTQEQRFSGAFSVAVTAAGNHVLAQPIRLKRNTDYLWVFYYRNAGDGVINGRVLAGNREIAAFPGRKNVRWQPWSLHFNTGSNEDVTLAIVCSGPQFHLDDCVLVENPQWVKPLPASATRPAHAWSDSTGDGKWSTADNWEPKSVPGQDGTVHHRRKNKVDRIVMDRDVTIANAWVHWDDVLTGSGEFYRAEWLDDGGGRTVTVTDSLCIMNAGRSVDQAWTDNAVSELSVSNLHLRIGTATQPAEFLVAFDRSASRQSPRTGRLTVQGGSVTAWLSYLGIGRDMGSLHGPQGIVDLSRCRHVKMAVTGNLDLGHMSTWDGSYHAGTLHCGGGEIEVGGDLHLGDARQQGRNGVGSSGRLFLFNTRLAIKGTAMLSGMQASKGREFERRFARIRVTVAGQCSGPDLRDKRASALAFTFGKQNDADAPDLNLVEIEFTDNPPQPDGEGWTWGLRWVGDHVATLRGYLNEAHPRLKVDVTRLPAAAKAAHLVRLRNLAPEVYAQHTVMRLTSADYVTYDPGTDKTYVGIYVGDVSP